MNILAADIGGTKARFALIGLGGHGLEVKIRSTYPSGEIPSAREAVVRFLDETSERMDMAAIAVAGPVVDGGGILTNLGWHVRESDVREWVGTDEVLVLNDFAALAHAIPLLESDDVTVIQQGADHATGVIALLGAGTGLGQALITTSLSGSAATVHPTEGGHASFAARTDTEWALRAFLRQRHGDHVSWERVLSGMGLQAAYEFSIWSGRFSEDPTTQAAMKGANPVPVIVERALLESDGACTWALATFVSAYGARAGDVALSAGATAGVYLAGGITLRIRDSLRRRGFLEAFLDKGRMSAWLERVPVKVIARDDAGMLGAAVAVVGAATRHEISRLPSSDTGI